MSGDLGLPPAGDSMRWMKRRPRADQERDHFYPTPPGCIEPLLKVERFAGPIWEPACGDGAISRVLAAAGYSVVSTDLVDRGFGLGRVDFLMERALLAPNVFTNPPFKLAEAFAWKALDLGCDSLSLLCRIQWLQGIERRKLFTGSPLAAVWVLPFRPMFRAGEAAEKMGGGMIAYAWFVWRRGHAGPPALGWL